MAGQAWDKYPKSHGYLTKYQGPGTDTPHYAYDFATPLDTPLFFLQSGTVVKADYAPWGGEVFLKPDGGGPQEYFYHLDMLQTAVGQHVSAGQIIGLSGGQTSGGHHPTLPQYSTGPHTHFGLFNQYVNTPMGLEPYGPDPGSLLSGSGGVVPVPGQPGTGTTSPVSLFPPFDLVSSVLSLLDILPGFGTPATTTITLGLQTGFTSVSEQTHNVLVNFPGFEGIILAINDAEQFPGVVWYTTNSLNPFDQISALGESIVGTITGNILPMALRSFLVVVGVLLLLGLVWNFVQQSGILDTAMKLLPLLAEAA